MLQWEIYNFPHPSAENPHPCVILSPSDLADNPQVAGVNVLACTSLRPSGVLKSTEVRLNGADGLDGPTVVKCNFILAFAKRDVLGPKRGLVTLGRRQAIKNMLARVFGIYYK